MMMKLVIVLLSVVAASVAAIDTYPTKYDHIDVAAIIANKRLMDNYVQCLLKRGTCSEEGSVLREIIPDALTTECSKCNELQKNWAEKVIKHLVEERKSDWEDLLKEYDPEGKYMKQYKKNLDAL